MTSVYARTREREKAWKLGMYCLLGSVFMATPWYTILKRWNWFDPYYPVLQVGYDSRWSRNDNTDVSKIFWVFSQILESVCVIPQLLLLRQTTVPTVLDSYYLVTLGSYRFLYVLNWIVRGATEPDYHDITSWVWGTVQTALMIDFAWVYYTRQRVKLRQGGVVDSEDLGRGWLVGRFVGRKSLDFDFDEEAASTQGNNVTRPSNKWGRRGISVSADEGVEGAPSRNGYARGNASPESQPLADPAAFEDESDDETPPPANVSTSEDAHRSGVRSDEWNDDVDEDATEHRTTT